MDFPSQRRTVPEQHPPHPEHRGPRLRAALLSRELLCCSAEPGCCAEPGAGRASSLLLPFSFIKPYGSEFQGKGRDPCKLLFHAQSVFILIIISIPVTAQGDGEGKGETLQCHRVHQLPGLRRGHVETQRARHRAPSRLKGPL